MNNNAVSLETKKFKNQRRASKRTTMRTSTKRKKNNPPKRASINPNLKKNEIKKDTINSESTDLKDKKKKTIRKIQ